MSGTTRYFLFNSNTFSRTGELRSVKNASTREEARSYKRTSNQNLKIFDRAKGAVIR